jgi:hypothetical protein
MMDLYIEQGILNLQILLKEIADYQLARDIMRITISRWNWNLGTGKDPFREHKHQYPQDESKWLHSVRKFAVQQTIQIRTGNNEYLLQRTHDRYIMKWAEEMGFTSFKIRFLNHCHLYLNVISVSNIADELGGNLDTSIMEYKSLPIEKKNSQVNQNKPDHTKWSIWFKFIAKIIRRNQRILKQPLGEGIVNFGQIRKTYTSYRTSIHTYKYRNDRIQIWGIINLAGIEWTGMVKEEVESMPEEVVPCLQSYTGMIYTHYNKASSSYKDTSIKEMSNSPRNQIRGQIITGDTTRTFIKVLQNEIMTIYYKRKLGDSYDNLEWSVFKQALVKKRAKGALLKMIHGITPTKKHITKYD